MQIRKIHTQKHLSKHLLMQMKSKVFTDLDDIFITKQKYNAYNRIYVNINESNNEG